MSCVVPEIPDTGGLLPKKGTPAAPISGDLNIPNLVS